MLLNRKKTSILMKNPSFTFSVASDVHDDGDGTDNNDEEYFDSFASKDDFYSNELPQFYVFY